MGATIKYRTSAVFEWTSGDGEKFHSPACRDSSGTFSGGFAQYSPPLSGGNWRTGRWEQKSSEFDGRIIPTAFPDREGTISGIVKDGDTGYGRWSDILAKGLDDIYLYMPYTEA